MSDATIVRLYDEIESQRVEGELIAEQVDTIALRRWGRRALERKGAMLGATGLLRPMVRRQARSRLAGDIARSG